MADSWTLHIQQSTTCKLCTFFFFLNTRTNEKISRQTFTDILNLRCDLDLEHSNPTFPQNTLAYDAVLSNQVCLQMDRQFRKCSKNSHILII